MTEMGFKLGFGLTGLQGNFQQQQGDFFIHAAQAKLTSPQAGRQIFAIINSSNPFVAEIRAASPVRAHSGTSLFLLHS